MTRQIEAYRRRGRHLDRYCRITVLDFGERAAVEFQHLRKLHPRIGSMDLQIAAIVRSKDDTPPPEKMAAPRDAAFDVKPVVDLYARIQFIKYRRRGRLAGVAEQRNAKPG